MLTFFLSFLFLPLFLFCFFVSLFLCLFVSFFVSFFPPSFISLSVYLFVCLFLSFFLSFFFSSSTWSPPLSVRSAHSSSFFSFLYEGQFSLHSLSSLWQISDARFFLVFVSSCVSLSLCLFLCSLSPCYDLRG